MSKIVSVVSPKHSFGTTTVISNIAVVLAQLGKRVCIVDTTFDSPLLTIFGFNDSDVKYTLNDFLWGKCDILETLMKVDGDIWGNTKGEIFIVPTSVKAGEMTRMNREGYDVGMLNNSFKAIADNNIDFLLVDTKPGVSSEESLLSIAISDAVIVVSRLHLFDYAKTMQLLDVVRRLDVPKSLLIINKVPNIVDIDKARQRINETYEIPLAAFIEKTDELFDPIDEIGVFVSKYPNHLISEEFRKCAALIMGEKDLNTQSQESKFPYDSSVGKKIEIASLGYLSSELNQLFNELNSLIGLRKVKGELYQLVQFVRIQKMRREIGLGKMDISLHSVFYGSPGTGKTTVARIYGKMLKAMGLLSSGHLVETDRSGLVAKYVGQTAVKTDEKISEALGGILFIDEAYSLFKDEHSQDDFGMEAIEILLKRMEDNRNDFAVIVAGYPQPMNNLLNSNEGLKSRFVNNIYFEDFSPEELMEIFTSTCLSNGYELKDGSHERLAKVIQIASSNRDRSFGNARYCRNLFEKVIRVQALRISETIKKPTENDLQAILPDDIASIDS